MPTVHRAHRRTVQDPRAGDVLNVPAGTRLEVRFRRTLSSWHVEDRPGHLVPLQATGYDFEFLVFGTPQAAARPLRLVRQRAGRQEPGEVREVMVLVSP